MARYKRYFPVSHEINRDPEVWEITDQFGDRSLRFILEIFSLLDRHENRLPITDQLMASLSRMLRQSLAKCWRILDQMLAKHWLIADEVLANGRPAIVSARNYAEYHRTRSVISAISETKREQIGDPPKLPKQPTLPKEERNKEKKELVSEGDPSHQSAIRVLEFLNQKTNKSFKTYDGLNGRRKPTASLEFVLERLKDGATEADCRMVIARKCRDWKDDPKMRPYLRPSTLFNRTKFDQYLGEMEPDDEPLPRVPETPQES